MGYQIHYGNTFTKIITKDQNPAGKGRKAIAIIALCVITLSILFATNGSGILHYILPGDPVVTEAALTSMIQDIQEGTPVNDAAYAFCLEIFQDALTKK